MAQSIPASAIVSVTPGVISAGGSALDIIGLLLTQSTQSPIGAVQAFSTQAAVAAYFGSASAEAAFATVYFNGYDNSALKPASLLVAQYPYAAVAGYARGGAGLTLAQIQAVTSGTLAVTVDGVLKTSSSINLSAASSPSNAATIIAAAFTGFGATVTWDSVSGAFVITSSTTGASSSIAVTTGTVATSLLLTAATGAVVSAGAVAAAPGTFMDALVAVTQNFVSFTTQWETTVSDGTAFAAWTNGKNNRYRFVLWDTDATVATTVPATTSAGYAITQAKYSGTVLVYSPVNAVALGAFALSIPACENFAALNGRNTSAFRSQAGLPADVTSSIVATNVQANAYNFYGAYATANDGFTFYYPGSITGKFLWDDSYVNEVWLNNALQLSLMTLLTNVGNIPYNPTGYGLIRQGCQDPINQALNFGAIRAGVTLSALQKAEINNAAGVDAATVIQNRGWYLQVQDAPAGVRAARGSPPITLWYSDGQSVQSVALSSLEVQ